MIRIFLSKIIVYNSICLKLIKLFKNIMNLLLTPCILDENYCICTNILVLKDSVEKYILIPLLLDSSFYKRRTQLYVDVAF